MSIIKPYEFLENLLMQGGIGELTKKYVDQNIEVSNFELIPGSHISFIPPESEHAQKLYIITKGSLYCKDTHDVCGVQTLIVLKNQDDFLNMRVKEPTHVMLFSIGERSYEKSSDDFENMIHILLEIEKKDAYTYGHSIRVANLVNETAEFLGITGKDLRHLSLAAKFHDIGKVDIPDDILNKPSSLTQDEYKIMKGHASLGLCKLEKVFGEEVSKIASEHHERIDGSGYPNGLKDHQISKFGKILAVCDVFDAMTTQRVYKKGKSANEALEYLNAHKNILFDASAVDALTNIVHKKTIKIHPIWRPQNEKC